MLVSLRFPVYALDFWGVLSGNIGLSWLSPAALTGVAVAGIARGQGWSRPRLLGGVAGVVTGAVLLIEFVAWGASIEPRWADEMAITPAQETAETAPATPARKPLDTPRPQQLSPPDDGGWAGSPAASGPGPCCRRLLRGESGVPSQAGSRGA
jgi:hypothetical protein